MADSQEKQSSSGKGKAFFDRGDQVAETGNWDFAIQMYLEGIRREPGNIERGHGPMRNVSLNRKVQGGKPAGFMEAMKRRGGKEPIDVLVNAEFLLAKDPGNVSHMEAVLKAAQKLDQPEVVKWMCHILFEAMRQAKSPDKRILIMISDAFAETEEFASALSACDMALQADPNNVELQEKAKDLSAKGTIKQGKYDTEGSFVESVRDLEKQKELAQKDHMSQSRDFLENEIEKGRAKYEASPDETANINALVDALLKIEEEGYENEAIDILKKAYADSGEYRYKVRSDDVLIRQMRRRHNKLKTADRKDEAIQLAHELLEFELEVYAERAKNYPTDLSVKYELGRRLLTADRIDDAISYLQQAQRDPKRRITALTYLGQAFEKKEWHREAVETYEKALEFEPSEARAKELHYNLGQVLKAMGEKAKALDHFSRVAQMDYNFRDVREQVEALRKEIQ
ncbi:MAG: tetratricopeptide repeat protein [Planctomycetota bacterium]|nr:tetratricopeptide repeat protein [Planctomycetota bacterium]